MAVIFDEVTGSVEPDTGPQDQRSEDASPPAPQQPGPEYLHHEIHRLTQRQARLYAD
jgi:hypothetical protein